MGQLIALRDTQAGPQGAELEPAEAAAREHAPRAAAEGLSLALILLSRVPGCERLGVDSLGAGPRGSGARPAEH